jgi:hypothetical protein
MKVRDLAILSFPSVEDLSAKDGFVVIPDAANPGHVKLANAVDAAPVGVITTPANGATDNISVAVVGFTGTVRVKLGGAVNAFDALTLKANGTLEANGAGTIVAKAMESGAADELIEAVLVAAITTDAASVAALGAAIDAVEADVAAHEVRLDAIDTADTGALALLDGRVTVLEGE